MPKYLYEAAAIDRVSAWRRFWTITFPYIRGLLMLALLFRTIEAFKLADLVILLTKGGNDTMTISYHLIRIANEQNKTSEGAAISYIMLFMVIVLTNLYLYLANRRNQGGLSHGDSISFWERLGFRRASGVGEAGWGRTLVAALVSLHLFPAGALHHLHRLQAAGATRCRCRRRCRPRRSSASSPTSSSSRRRSRISARSSPAS